ncbi:DUF547 domain-containing protein [Rubrivirga sp. IMCC43871]|uniref:DUF547 domain-containing protein n=1 Tax=Rubrivirga sp. IMCC43871 TaxID=3391575 RepID=UPI00399002FF
MTRALCLAVLLAPAVLAQPAVEAPLTRALDAVGSDGLVDYARFAGPLKGDLDAALAAVAAQSPGALRSDAQKTAFLVNAYNTHVLAALASRPRARHFERDGLFDDLFQTPVRVAGLAMTLNQLEHGILRRQAEVDGRTVPRALRALRPSRLDPRIHAALNCGAVSCPPLATRAYRAATLDADLGRQFAAFMATSRAVRSDGRTLVLSSLFDWFAADFADGRRLGDALLAAMPPARASAARDWLARRTADQLRADRRVRFAYDWTVNRAR